MSGSTGYGITIQGFVRPLLSDIQTEIQNSLYSTFGADINVEPESFFGQIVGLFSERESLIWDAMQDVYDSQNPDEAFGASLDNVGSLRGIPRNQALASVQQNYLLFGSSGTVVPAGTQFSVQNSPASIFQLLAAVTLVAGASCVQTITFSAVPASGTWQLDLGGTETALINWNDSLSTIQTKVQALEFASGCIVTQLSSTVLQIAFNGVGTGGFMVQPLFIISESALEDGSSNPITITPAITVPGLNQASVSLTATNTGAVIANAGTLTNIVTPVSGLTGGLNIQDATVGQAVEQDNAYRTRMAQELQIAGAGTVEAIRAKLLEVSGVTAVIIFENTDDVPDGEGRPPHCFEAVVQGGDAATIAETIWLTKPAGIATYGNQSYVITDSQGQTHTIYYSLPTAVPVYIIANITTDDTYPSNGDTLVDQALVTYGNSLGIGAELIVIPRLIAQIALIQGIQDAVLLVGTAPAPVTSDNITPTAYEILSFDTSRVQVNDV